MAPNRQVTELLLTLKPVLRRPVAVLIAARYGLGPRSARAATAAAFAGLAGLQRARKLKRPAGVLALVALVAGAVMVYRRMSSAPGSDADD